MALLEFRQRTGYLFLVVLLGHVILISAQVQSEKGVPLLSEVAFSVLAEVQRVTSGGFGAVQRGWSSYIGLRGVYKENLALKDELAATRLKAEEQRAIADRTRGLEQLLELKNRLEIKTTAAEVIAAGVTLDFRAITISKGSLQGIRGDMAVIAPEGVVGRVVATSPTAAQVQLLIDANAAAGAIIERSRAQGIAVGAGDRGFILDKVSEASDIVVGDRVVTSGIEGTFAIYPKGFLIGTVSAVKKLGSAYSEILVKPAVDFSRLEDVLVVLTPTQAGDASTESSR